MEVSGRKKLSPCVVNASSEEEFLCDPCLKDGQELPAEGFCIDCQHYLCDICFKYHLRPLPLRHHALLDKSNMPKTKIPCNDVCKQHKDEPIEYYCQSHSQVACRRCKTTTHKQCNAVKYIKELAEETKFSDEVKTVMHKIDRYEFKFNEKKRWTGQIVSVTEKSYDTVIKNVHELRKEFDKFEERITKEAKLYKDQENQSMNDISSICDRNLHELQKKKEELNTLMQLQSKQKLFIHTKKVDENMIVIEKSLENLQHKKAILIKFDPDQEKLRGILSNYKILKDNDMKQMNLSLKPRKDYHVIDGLNFGYPIKYTFLPDGQLIAADPLECSVHLVNLELLYTTSNIKLSSTPKNITTTKENEVAVTLPDEKKIVFVTVSKTVTLKKKITVTGDCHGIVCFEDKLAVTFRSLDLVQILKMDGTVIKTISPTINGVKILSNCIDIAISPNKKTMYLSSEKKVFSVTLDGVVLARHSMSSNGVCVDEKGTVFVADEYIVHAFTENELKKIVSVDIKAESPERMSNCSISDIVCRNNWIYTFRYHDYYTLTEICYTK